MKLKCPICKGKWVVEQCPICGLKKDHKPGCRFAVSQFAKLFTQAKVSHEAAD